MAISTNEEKKTPNEESFNEKTQRKLAIKAVLTFQRKIQPDKSNKVRTDNHNPSFIAAETDDNLVTKNQSHSLIARKPFLETNNNNYQSQEYVEHVEPSIHPDLLEKISKFYNQNNDETGSISSTNSYAELDTDGETITLSDNDDTDIETREAPPRKKFKSNHSPAMF